MRRTFRTVSCEKETSGRPLSIMDAVLNDTPAALLTSSNVILFLVVMGKLHEKANGKQGFRQTKG